MSKEFLKEVIVILIGKQAEMIVDLLESKKYVNEFVIAKKLDLTINQTRNILYKLSDHRLVSSIRKKDKRKGWYTYFWKIEPIKTLEFLRDILIKRINQINYQIKSRESKKFYICKRCNIEFNEETALLHDFTCNECGDVFTLQDNPKVLKDLRKNFDKNNKELKLVEEEIRKEKEKAEKIKIKDNKKKGTKKVKLKRKIKRKKIIRSVRRKKVKKGEGKSFLNKKVKKKKKKKLGKKKIKKGNKKKKVKKRKW